jgi:hypothetical protein
MKISVDDKELFTLSDVQKQVIKNDIHADTFDADMNRRLQWVLMHKYEECFKRLKAEWDPKLLANGVAMIPTDPDAYAQLIFTQPNYQDRAMRESSQPLPSDIQ